MVYRKMKFNKRVKVKGIIKKLKDVPYDEILGAQTVITEKLQEKYDENEIVLEGEIFKD